MSRPSSPYAGMTVRVKPGCDTPYGDLSGRDYVVEDYWENVYGCSWMSSNGNPAALRYAIRAASRHLPLDNEVLYGKIGALGFLMHVSELELPEVI